MPSAAAPSPAPDRAKFRRARQRVAAIKGFYIHLAVFVMVLTGLFVVNAATAGEWWVHWVFIGWGIGLAAHAAAVYGRAPAMVASWERRKLRQLMQEPS